MLHKGEDSVRREANRDRAYAFEADDLGEQPDRNALAQKNRHQLVRGGKKHRQQSANRNGAAGIKGSGRGRNTALRNSPRKRSGRRANRTSALQKPLERTARVRLHRFKDEIRRKEKRKEEQRLADEFRH